MGNNRRTNIENRRRERENGRRETKGELEKGKGSVGGKSSEGRAKEGERER